MIQPYVRVSYHDQDNFVRNLVTILMGDAYVQVPTGGLIPPLVNPLSKSARDLEPVLTLDQVKAHLRINASQTAEDAYLIDLEMAARIHTQNTLRRDIDATVGENVKTAMLLLLAHWYRNREAIGEGRIMVIPLAYDAILAPERLYDGVY